MTTIYNQIIRELMNTYRTNYDNYTNKEKLLQIMIQAYKDYQPQLEEVLLKYQELAYNEGITNASKQSMIQQDKLIATKRIQFPGGTHKVFQTIKEHFPNTGRVGQGTLNKIKGLIKPRVGYGEARHGALPRRAAHLPADDGAGEPRNGRLHAPRQGDSGQH